MIYDKVCVCVCVCVGGGGGGGGQIANPFLNFSGATLKFGNG